MSRVTPGEEAPSSAVSLGRAAVVASLSVLLRLAGVETLSPAGTSEGRFEVDMNGARVFWLELVVKGRKVGGGEEGRACFRVCCTARAGQGSGGGRKGELAKNLAKESRQVGSELGPTSSLPSRVAQNPCPSYRSIRTTETS